MFMVRLRICYECELSMTFLGNKPVGDGRTDRRTDGESDIVHCIMRACVDVRPHNYNKT